MKEFGFPPVFPRRSGEEKHGKESDHQEETPDLIKTGKKVGMNFSSDITCHMYRSDGFLIVQVKSKLAAKGDKGMYQWIILRNLGMKDKEIRR